MLWVKGLRKTFKEHQSEIVLKEVDLKLGAGEVYCLLGANGSGKTTFLRTLLDIYPRDLGEIRFFGASLTSESKRRVGYSEDKFPGFSFLKVREFLELSLSLYNDSPGERRTLSERWLKEVNLWPHREKLLGKLSRGMERRLALAQAMSHDPDLLILDEPFEGLDFEGLDFFQRFLSEFRQKKKAVLLTTHLYTQVRDFASRVGVLYDGRILEGEALEATALPPALKKWILEKPEAR